MKEIPLSQGYVAWVDDEDYEDLSRFKWFACRTHRSVYAVRNARHPKRGLIHMHREILKPPVGVQVDHRRHRDDLVVDNRRENLRLAPGSINQRNQRKQARSTHSIFKGVSFYTRDRRWSASIKVEGKRYNLGSFRDEGHAAYAYDLAAVRLFGEFALTNFPVPGSMQWEHGPQEASNG